MHYLDLRTEIALALIVCAMKFGAGVAGGSTMLIADAYKTVSVLSMAERHYHG